MVGCSHNTCTEFDVMLLNEILPGGYGAEETYINCKKIRIKQLRESHQIAYKNQNTFCVCVKRLRHCGRTQIFNTLYFCVHSEHIGPVRKQVSNIKTGTVVGVKCIVVVCVCSLIIYRVIISLYFYPVIGDDSFRMTWLGPGQHQTPGSGCKDCNV